VCVCVYACVYMYRHTIHTHTQQYLQATWRRAGAEGERGVLQECWTWRRHRREKGRRMRGRLDQNSQKSMSLHTCVVKSLCTDFFKRKVPPSRGFRGPHAVCWGILFKLSGIPGEHSIPRAPLPALLSPAPSSHAPLCPGPWPLTQILISQRVSQRASLTSQKVDPFL